VTLEDSLDDSDVAMLTRLVENHLAYTDSDRAAELLDDWQSALSEFVKVMPDAYAEVIAEDSREDVRSELPAKAGAIVDSGTDKVGAATTSDD
jgi:glutamate synthase (NADPH/NADH) large chain